MSLDDFPRHPLLFGPSPVHRLERLTAHLGGAALWAKRDDCNCGLAYGGNKTRKLEYLVADALAQGCDTLVSIGGVQSNHTRQVAAVAARVRAELRARAGELGRLARRRLRPRRQHPAQPDHGRRRAAGEAGFGIGFKESWEQALADVEAAGGKPYAIPAGASDHRLGGLGFASWALEVEAQERELGVFFDTIVVCSVTGCTQAGHDRRLRRPGRASGASSASTARPSPRRRATRSPGSPAPPPC